MTQSFPTSCIPDCKLTCISAYMFHIYETQHNMRSCQIPLPPMRELLGNLVTKQNKSTKEKSVRERSRFYFEELDQEVKSGFRVVTGTSFLTIATTL